MESLVEAEVWQEPNLLKQVRARGGAPAEGEAADTGTWAPVEALGQRKRVSIYQPHYLHVSILLSQHSGCGSTVVSCVHFDSL